MQSQDGLGYCNKKLLLNLGFPHSSVGKESACNAGDLGLIPGSGRSLGEGNGNPLQYSRLENPMDRGVWWVTVHRVAKSQTWIKQLSMHIPMRLLRILKELICVKCFRLHVTLSMGFPDSSVGKESACNAGNPGLIPGLGRSPGEGIGYPLQYFWASPVALCKDSAHIRWFHCH